MSPLMLGHKAAILSSAKGAHWMPKSGTMIGLGLLVVAMQCHGVDAWISSSDLIKRLEPQEAIPVRDASGDADIVIEPSKTYQRVLGLGASLEHSTCYNLSRLPEAEREAAVERIVDPEKGIGMDLMRICIGTPDFTASDWYTYDDMPEGETDPAFQHFSIEKDRAYVLPILKLALKKNPNLLFAASPWSPPGWMTSNDRIGGGRMLPKHFAAYAQYFVKFIRAYEEEGIPIYAVTPQNEPDYAPRTYPTCKWRGEEQRDFIRDHLGPAFERNGIQTEIWCWDHNFNLLDFPRAILKDSKAARYTDATAFHLYEGEPEAMTTLHNEFPDKDIHFTEGSTFGVAGAIEIITFLRNWARSYCAWVVVIDTELGPNPGPHGCSPTAIMLDTEDLSLDYRFEYYMYGQFTKFIQRGAIRIHSSENEKDFANVALRNLDGSFVLVVANAGKEPRTFDVSCENSAFSAELPPESVGTYLWQP